MPAPSTALIVSSYQQPGHLYRCLLSISHQLPITRPFEVVVADDGSEDETADMVAEFARFADFPLSFSTHPHRDYQLARCRNEGARATTAPYLLFIDGDCVLPRDHVIQHVSFQSPGYAVAGDCARLDSATSEQISPDVIRSGDLEWWIPAEERKRLAAQHRKAAFYNLIRHPQKPKLIGNNIGIWREDFERVNGFDEAFQGWGGEDDDLRMRLRQSGTRIKSILARTCLLHLWHPRDPSTPQRWRDGRNAGLVVRKSRPTRCPRGFDNPDREPSTVWRYTRELARAA